MDFFRHQDQARRNTWLLVTLLIAAVISLIVITSLVATLFLHYFEIGDHSQLGAGEYGGNLWQAWWASLSGKVVVASSLIITTSIALASLIQAYQLKRGGEAVAATLNGRLINRDLATGQEQQLLNVVEEMAIASGTPVPDVYLFPESSINAFAAGYSTTDAVIGITQGALDALNREQLQGVVAHEFSHILHGDMRLNLRLVSLLSGILVIGLAGRFLLRGSRRSSFSHSRSRKRDGRVALLGLALVVIGYTGTLFGRMIAAATSRQREFLADASAVQYTRNPNGIAGALAAIQQQSSLWQHEKAAEFSHMFFGQGIRSSFNQLFATHPPITERINRIAPNFVSRAVPETTNATITGFHKKQRPSVSPLTAAVSPRAEASEVAATSELTPEQLTAARQQIEQIPEALLNAAEDIFSGRAIIYGLLLHKEQTLQQTQLAHLSEKSHPVVYKQLHEIFSATRQLPLSLQWILLLKSLATLRRMSARQQQVFLSNVKFLISADEEITLFEWCVFELVKQSCAVGSTSKLLANTRQINHSISVLLSFIAHNSNASNEAIDQQFATAKQLFNKLQILARHEASVKQLSQCLAALKSVAPLARPKLLKAVAGMIQMDGQITADEIVLLRTLALCIDCPLPANITLAIKHF
ncbi:M48 family metallopeptidase [Halioxenophilus sp. WMMB6]|uniref:M48 family metallopeptidase n=1 Tax=Halioxenophilus sp. WMMB6 TaxID=3073815 RepID=UPI00295E6668|nr:M48 family metallopeptidase [Halioxenophilus sp. WMMB6]